MRTPLRRFAMVLGALWALYLVAGNVFLNSPWARDAVNRRPERFQLLWSNGFTWFPGYLVLRDVKAKGHVRRVLWTAQAPYARGHLALSALLYRELRLTSIDAADVVAEADRTDEEIAPPAQQPGAWTLRFDRIATRSLRHLRAGALDLDVEGSADVGFIKQLHGGALEILPSTFDLARVRIVFRGHEVLRDAKLTGGFSIASHLPSEVSGVRKLALTDAHLNITGSMPRELLALDPSGHWDDVAASGVPNGSLQANLALRRGVLQEGGQLDLRVPMSAAAGGNDAALRAHVEAEGTHIVLRVPAPAGDEGGIDADFRVDDNTVESLMEAPGGWQRVSGTASLDWGFTSINGLAALLIDKPWLALQGAGHVNAVIALVKGALQPGSRIDMADLDLVALIAGFQFKGRVLAEGRLVRSKGSSRAHVRLGVPHFDVAGAKAGMKPLVSGNALRIDLDSAPTIEGVRDSLIGQLRFDKATVPDLRVLNAYLPEGTFGATGGAADLSSNLRLDAEGRVLGGRIGLSGHDAQIVLGNLHIGGDFDLDAHLAGSDPRRRFYDLDGSVLQTRHVHFIGPSPQAGSEDAWANLVIKRGRVEASKPLGVESNVDVEFQNISLLLGLFAQHRDYPKWALKIADAGVLRASASMRIDGKTVVFDPVAAKNDRVDVKARMRFAGQAPTGDLLVRWGLLSFGLEINEGQREFHFLRAGAWFDHQPALEAR